jgi:ADP-ribosylglycohydrolase
MTDAKFDSLARALCSLEGLSVGDAFGEQFFGFPFGSKDLIKEGDILDAIEARILPPSPWHYTDDTNMALSVVSILRQYQRINQDILAFSFAARYESARGYGPAMHWLMRAFNADSQNWAALAGSLFDGQGSFGNGAAMRVAPLGAYFADDMDAVVQNAALSAEVTHAHKEAVAGAIATAVAAAYATRLRGQTPPGPREFIELVLPHIPDSIVREKVRHARDMSPGGSVLLAMSRLGNGSEISAQDTVPFVLWCAARSLSNYEEALWLTVSGLGDRDTTCAMVGGIVACYTGVEAIPEVWRQAREPLPTWILREQSEI